MDVVGWLETVQFLLLAVVVGRLWRSQRNATCNWLAATFFTIATVVVVGHFLPQHPTGAALGVVVRLLIIAIVAFPYLLYRFALTFATARFARLRRAVDVLMLALAAWAAALPKIPRAGAPLSAAFTAFIAVVVVVWVGLTLTVAILMWRWSNAQPPVARSRMRMMSAAAAGLALALLTGVGSNSAQPGPAQLAGGLLVLLTVPCFLIAVSPPGPLLAHWRARDRQRLLDSTLALVKAVTPQEVADGLLPSLTSFIGGSGAALLHADRTPWARHALTDDRLTRLIHSGPDDPTVHQHLSDGSAWVAIKDGWMVVETSRFTPFFGTEDVQILASMAAVADMAMARIEFAETERRHVEAMRDFVAIASHELRTPITTIGGFTNVLRRRWQQMPDGERQDAISAISRQSQVLSRLVEDLLTVSRIDGGALAPSPELVDVATAVPAIVAELGIPGVEVRMNAPGAILIDPEHLRRILTNYLRNAEVYGAPPITVESFQRDESVVIQVCDHGPGVPEEFRPRLFGKFARADKKTSRAIGGTGLGLSIVDGLARAAGGVASYQPAPGGGSIFQVTVPVAVPAQTRSEQAWTRAEFSSSSKTKQTSAG